MERTPYQDPQTSMERHVAELVAHLRDGTDNRAGFAERIESAMAHAFWLEARCKEMHADIVKLEKAMMPALPPISCRSEIMDSRAPSTMYPCRGGALVFDWEMQAIRWRGMWQDYDQPDKETADRVKRRTYKELMHLVRKEFERTWTLNFSRRRAA